MREMEPFVLLAFPPPPRFYSFFASKSDIFPSKRSGFVVPKGSILGVEKDKWRIWVQGFETVEMPANQGTPTRPQWASELGLASN